MSNLLPNYQPSLYVYPIHREVSLDMLHGTFSAYGRVEYISIKQGKKYDFAVVDFRYYYLEPSLRMRDTICRREVYRNDRYSVTEYKKPVPLIAPVPVPEPAKEVDEVSDISSDSGSYSTIYDDVDAPEEEPLYKFNYDGIVLPPKRKYKIKYPGNNKFKIVLR